MSAHPVYDAADPKEVRKDASLTSIDAVLEQWRKGDSPTPEVIKKITSECHFIQDTFPESWAGLRAKIKKALPKGAKIVSFDKQTDDVNRPYYKVHEGKNDYGRPGVYYHGVKTDNQGNTTEIDLYICDPLYIDAGSCDKSDNNFGMLLRFKNQRGNWRKWLMPADMLSGNCEELRAQLLGMGLRIDHQHRAKLPGYLQSITPPEQLECALKVGWHDDTFVLPDRVIGNREDVFFQSDHAIHAEYGQSGTLKDWQDNVSKYCINNPLPMFQVSTAFAGPLLKKVHMDYAGFHVHGPSTRGKSTGEKMAVSVYGSKDFMRSWRATANGLEAAAVLFNDCLLALDELGDSDAHEVNRIIYSLGNGQGKQRANAKGTARSVHKWRLILLSNGEKTLEAHFQEKGLTVKAGQLVRFLQIPVFGKFGAFDDLHDMESGRELSDYLQGMSEWYYGTAGIAFLEKLVNDDQDFGGALEAAISNLVTSDMQPQEQRAARAFALIAVAGELATAYGITGWPEKAAFNSVKICFEKWREARGKGELEDNKIIEAVQDFISQHGDSRFSDKALAKSDRIVINRAGYFSDSIETNYRVYLFNSAGFKEAIKGYEMDKALAVLQKAGLFLPGRDRPASQHKINGVNDRFYQIRGGEVEPD